LKEINSLLLSSKGPAGWELDHVGLPFNTNILRVCLNLKEEKIA